MAERRSLIDGIKPDSELHPEEEKFVFGAKREKTAKPTVPQALSTAFQPVIPETRQHQEILPQMMGRVPVTTRCRPEIASALKKAALNRQLAGIEPYHVQDIMEIAIEQWLSNNFVGPQ